MRSRDAGSHVPRGELVRASSRSSTIAARDVDRRDRCRPCQAGDAVDLDHLTGAPRGAHQIDARVVHAERLRGALGQRASSASAPPASQIAPCATL